MQAGTVSGSTSDLLDYGSEEDKHGISRYGDPLPTPGKKELRIDRQGSEFTGSTVAKIRYKWMSSFNIGFKRQGTCLDEC